MADDGTTRTRTVTCGEVVDWWQNSSVGVEKLDITIESIESNCIVQIQKRNVEPVPPGQQPPPPVPLEGLKFDKAKGDPLPSGPHRIGLAQLWRAEIACVKANLDHEPKCKVKYTVKWVG